MSSGNFRFLINLFFISILVTSLGCVPENSREEEEEIGEPYVAAEIAGNFWVGDSITRSGLSIVRNSQFYSLMAQDENYSIYITLSESDTFEEGKIGIGKYSGTKIFMEFAQLYGPYAIQAYFQDRSTSDNEIEIIYSDGNTISGNFSGIFYKGDRNYPPVVDENSPDKIIITNGEFKNMPLDLFPTNPNQ